MATMANVKAQYTEDAIGQNHPTLADTVNRCVTGINNFRLIKSGANLTLEMVGGDLVDINGDIMQLAGAMPTLAPPSTAVQIEGMSRANPCVVTWTGHGLPQGARVSFAGITQGSWTAMNGVGFVVSSPGANNFTLLDLVGTGWNTSGYAADYVPATDPGTIQADVCYFIYLFNSSGTATLDASTTSPVADSKGRWIKTGYPAYRLIGMALRAASGIWATETTLVRSYNNRVGVTSTGVLTSDRGWISASWGEPTGATEARVRFLAWTDEVVGIQLHGANIQSQAGAVACYNSVGVDAAQAGEWVAEYQSNGVQKGVAVRADWVPTYNGLHWAYILANVQPGATANVNLSTSSTLRVTIPARG